MAGRKRQPAAWGTFEQEVWDYHQKSIERWGEKGRLDCLELTGIGFGSKMCVYFARMGKTPAHKIGKSAYADSRIQAIQISSPLPVKLVAWINAPTHEALARLEKQAHKAASMFGARSRGEWFNLGDGAIRKIIDAVVDKTPEDVAGVNYEL